MKNYKKNNNNLEDLIMTLKETKELLATGKQLKTFIKDKLPKIREESTISGYGIDKHNDGFCTEENIQSMNIRYLSFYSFSGSYGSSETYSDISNLNFDLMKEYFIKYLNNHKDEILIGVADLMINAAKKNKEEAIRELEEHKKELLDLFED